jgi:hypothetical protein
MSCDKGATPNDFPAIRPTEMISERTVVTEDNYLRLVCRGRWGQIEAEERTMHQTQTQEEAAQIANDWLEFQCPRHRHSIDDESKREKLTHNCISRVRARVHVLQ